MADQTAGVTSKRASLNINMRENGMLMALVAIVVFGAAERAILRGVGRVIFPKA